MCVYRRSRTGSSLLESVLLIDSSVKGDCVCDHPLISSRHKHVRTHTHSITRKLQNVRRAICIGFHACVCCVWGPGCAHVLYCIGVDFKCFIWYLVFPCFNSAKLGGILACFMGRPNTGLKVYRGLESHVSYILFTRYELFCAGIVPNMLCYLK